MDEQHISRFDVKLEDQAGEAAGNSAFDSSAVSQPEQYADKWKVDDNSNVTTFKIAADDRQDYGTQEESPQVEPSHDWSNRSQSDQYDIEITAMETQYVATIETIDDLREPSDSVTHEDYVESPPDYDATAINQSEAYANENSNMAESNVSTIEVTPEDQENGAIGYSHDTKPVADSPGYSQPESYSNEMAVTSQTPPTVIRIEQADVVKEKPNDYGELAALTCCLLFIVGIPAVMFVIRSRKAWAKGDYHGAKKMGLAAFACSMFGLCCVAAIIIAVLVVFLPR